MRQLFSECKDIPLWLVVAWALSNVVIFAWRMGWLPR